LEEIASSMAANNDLSCKGFVSIATTPADLQRFCDSTVVDGRYDNGRNFNVLARQMGNQLEPAHLGHLQVEEQAGRQAVRQRRKKCPSRPVRPHTESARAQQPRQRLQYGQIVVHDADPRGRFRHR
jgi:hypothetical protein